MPIRVLCFLSFLTAATIPSMLFAQEEQPAVAASVQSEFPDLTLPANGNVETLQAFVETARNAKPQSPEQYKAMQVAIRDGSRRILELLEDKPGSPAYQAAELQSISASVALMTYFSEKEQKALVEQLHDFLRGRKKLSIQDVQTGMMAATMLELQPNKKPSRDTYALLDELLENDDREEMQSLRVNLQAAVRRLNLLGSHFDIQTKSIDGTAISTDAFAGKYVIVDFFATWCEACLGEIPRLKRHYAKYKDKGLEIVGISLDAEREALDGFMGRANLPWPVIHDVADSPLDTLQMQFGVSSLPTVLLLNKEGDVVSLEARGAELDRLMDMLFEAPTPAEPPTTTSEETE